MFSSVPAGWETYIIIAHCLHVEKFPASLYLYYSKKTRMGSERKGWEGGIIFCSVLCDRNLFGGDFSVPYLARDVFRRWGDSHQSMAIGLIPILEFTMTWHVTCLWVFAVKFRIGLYIYILASVSIYLEFVHTHTVCSVWLASSLSFTSKLPCSYFLIASGLEKKSQGWMAYV